MSYLLDQVLTFTMKSGAVPLSNGVSSMAVAQYGRQVLAQCLRSQLQFRVLYFQGVLIAALVA